MTLKHSNRSIVLKQNKCIANYPSILYIRIVFTYSTDLKKNLQAPTMSLIRAFESIIGFIENWPTHILEHLFCEIPDLDALEGLIAFFFRNGIPCPMTCQFYHACNSRATASVTEQFYATNSFWESRTHEVHLAQYFNMTLKSICI